MSMTVEHTFASSPHYKTYCSIYTFFHKDLTQRSREGHEEDWRHHAAVAVAAVAAVAAASAAAAVDQ